MATPASPTYHRVVNAGSSSRPASTAAGLGSSLNASPSLYTYALSSPRVGHSNPGSISRNAPSPINGRSSATPTPGGRQQRRHQRNDSSNGSSLPANGGMSLHQHHHHHHPLGSAEWSWFGFDVPLTSLTSLRDALEGGSQGGEMGGGEADLGTSSNSRLHDGNSGGGEDNEIFGYDFGGGRWRVEMLKRTDERGAKQLTLYLGCSILDTDYPPNNVTIPTTVMVCAREPGSRGAILWQAWEEHLFRHENEYWECHSFPLPSTLLANPRVAASDAVLLSVQVQSPLSGPLPLVQNAKQVPCNLLSGLSGLLDDKKTGDVQFVVYERKVADPSTIGDIATLHLSDLSQPLYRKRTIYAHSAVLRARSTYFDDMLGSDWSETAHTEGNKSVVRITEFDYSTVYWLLHWIYTDEVTFAERERISQTTLEDFGHGLLGRISPGYDWQKLTFGSESGSSDCRTTVSERSELHIPPRAATSIGHNRRPTISTARQSRPSLPSAIPNVHTRLPMSGSSSSLGAGKARREGSASDGTRTLSPIQSLGSPIIPQLSPTTNTANKVFSSRNEDPHQHPVKHVPPVSALQLYRASHRYNLPELLRVSLDHIITCLTPGSAMPLLLATQIYPDLYEVVKAFSYDRYEEVVASPDFRRCCLEVGAGQWGEAGGEVLYDFMRALTPL